MIAGIAAFSMALGGGTGRELRPAISSFQGPSCVTRSELPILTKGITVQGPNAVTINIQIGPDNGAVIATNANEPGSVDVFSGSKRTPDVLGKDGEGELTGFVAGAFDKGKEPTAYRLIGDSFWYRCEEPVTTPSGMGNQQIRAEKELSVLKRDMKSRAGYMSKQIAKGEIPELTNPDVTDNVIYSG